MGLANIAFNAAHCQQGDFPWDDFELEDHEGPIEWGEEPDFVVEYGTLWTAPEGGIIVCRTYYLANPPQQSELMFSYQSMLQMEFGNTEILHHAQLEVPTIGDKALGMEVVGVNQRFGEVVVASVVFQRGAVIVSVALGVELSEANIDPNYLIEALASFIDASIEETVRIAQRIDKRFTTE